MKPGWLNSELLSKTLDALRAEVERDGRDELIIVEGEAPGADRMARAWAEMRGVAHVEFPANWSRGRSAGPIRNRQMLAAGADRVLAFSVEWPVAGGTRDMCIRADHDGVPVTVILPDGSVRGFDEAAVA